MSPASKTASILVLAGAVAVSSFLLSARQAPGQHPPGLRVIDGGVAVQAHLPSPYLLEGTGVTHLAVTLSAPDGASEGRPPLDLAIAIDRSGSMGGKALDDAKLAARHLIDRLSAADRFTVIAYGSHVEVVHSSTPASPAHKAAAVAAIERIYDGGGTNIGGGLMAARAQLIAHPAEGAVRRIVLISDGTATEGQCTRPNMLPLADPSCFFGLAGDIAREGISITTVGLGEEFDSLTMTGMATAGRGNYYFVSSTEHLSGMFDKELARLGATAATEVGVTLRPAAGVEVLEAYGYPMRREGSAIRVPIADLHAGQVRKVVFRLRVSTRGDFMELTRIGASFKTAAAERRVELVASAKVSRSAELVESSRDATAVRHIERARAAKAIEEANALYENGDIGAAKRLLEQHAASAAPEVRAEIAGVAGKAMQRMQAAPGSGEGKRGAKSNAADAYELFH